jgi:hypothetical protein
MPGQRLNIPQRLFSLLEKIFGECRVSEALLTFAGGTVPVPLAWACRPAEVALLCSVAVHSQEMAWSQVQVVDLLEKVERANVTDFLVGTEHPAIAENDLALLHSPPLAAVRLEMRPAVRDVFNKFNAKYFSSAADMVRGWELPHSGRIAAKQVQLSLSSYVRENTALMRTMVIKRRPVILNYVAESEQLEFWKMAVEQTGKEPRRLELIGVYLGIPLERVESFRWDSQGNHLALVVSRSAPLAGLSENKDVALFRDLETQKAVMVAK